MFLCALCLPRRSHPRNRDGTGRSYWGASSEAGGKYLKDSRDRRFRAEGLIYKDNITKSNTLVLELPSTPYPVQYQSIRLWYYIFPEKIILLSYLQFRQGLVQNSYLYGILLLKNVSCGRSERTSSNIISEPFSVINMRPLKNAQFCARPRKVKILTTGIHREFRGLKFEPDAGIGQKGAFCKGLNIGCQSHTFFNQNRVIKDLDFKGDGFHGIIPFLYNIHIWSYAVRKL